MVIKENHDDITFVNIVLYGLNNNTTVKTFDHQTKTNDLVTINNVKTR